MNMMGLIKNGEAPVQGPQRIWTSQTVSQPVAAKVAPVAVEEEAKAVDPKAARADPKAARAKAQMEANTVQEAQTISADDAEELAETQFDNSEELQKASKPVAGFMQGMKEAVLKDGTDLKLLEPFSNIFRDDPGKSGKISLELFNKEFLPFAEAVGKANFSEGVMKEEYSKLSDPVKNFIATNFLTSFKPMLEHNPAFALSLNFDAGVLKQMKSSLIKALNKDGLLKHNEKPEMSLQDRRARFNEVAIEFSQIPQKVSEISKHGGIDLAKAYDSLTEKAINNLAQKGIELSKEETMEMVAHLRDVKVTDNSTSQRRLNLGGMLKSIEPKYLAMAAPVVAPLLMTLVKGILAVPGAILPKFIMQPIHTIVDQSASLLMQGMTTGAAASVFTGFGGQTPPEPTNQNAPLGNAQQA